MTAELASRTFFTWDEDMRKYGRDIRHSKRGEAFLRVVDDDQLYFLDVIRSAPGHLAWDVHTLGEFYPEAIEDMLKLKELNFQSEFFVSPQVVEAPRGSRSPAGMPTTVMLQPTTLRVRSRPQPRSLCGRAKKPAASTYVIERIGGTR